MWHRIFCRSNDPLPPALLLEHLQAHGLAVEPHFRGDDLGWTGAELKIGIGSPVGVERYLANEDDLRDDLNSWAAWLETCNYSPNHEMLMERIIQTMQMITLRKPIDHADDVSLNRLCLEICRFFAARGDGVYQIEDDGWYDAAGSLLLKEY